MSDLQSLIDETRKVLANMTPGPWKWWYPAGASAPILVSPPHGLLVVMDASRNGMRGASIRFAKRSDNLGGVMLNAREFITSEQGPGRSVFCDMGNPDAHGIAHLHNVAPRLLEALDKMAESLRFIEGGHILESDEKDFNYALDGNDSLRAVRQLVGSAQGKARLCLADLDRIAKGEPQ